MKLRATFYTATLTLIVGCGGSNYTAENGSDSSGSGTANQTDAQAGRILVIQPIQPESISAKNYLQLNNTYSSVTDVPTNEPSVLEEYNAIITQLPATNNPESLNGFNQIAQTRLAFAYCKKYVDENGHLYSDLSDDDGIRLLLDSMVDVNIENNVAHAELYQNLLDIMRDSDGLLSEESGSDDDMSAGDTRPFTLSCTALLASSYISML